MRKRLSLFNEKDSVIHKMFLDSFFVMLASELSIAISKLVDALMVSNFMGPKMFAAQSLSEPFFGLVAITSGLLATGMQVRISKSIVKGNFKEADTTFTCSMLIGLIISGAITAICIIDSGLVAGFFGAAKDNSDLFESTRMYLCGLGLGSIPLTLNVVLKPVLQINGDRSRVKYTLFIVMGINCVINSLSIFVFKWGMFGIGLATAIAEWCGLIILLVHFTKRNITCKFRFSKPSLEAIKDVGVLGFPKATVRVCNTLRPLLVNRLILFLASSSAMAAVGVNNNIRDFFRIPETAIALSVMLLAGILYSEQDKESLKKLVRISMTYNYIINISLSVLLFIFAPLLTSIYLESGTEAHAMACTCLRWTSFGIMFYAINECFMDFMLGIGRHKQVHVYTICERFIYAVACAYILGELFGIRGVFASFSIAELCFTLHIVIVAWIKNKKFPTKLYDFMMISHDFDDEAQATLDISICNMDEVIGVSETVMVFCKENKVDSRRSYFAALCIEEMATNIVKHGFVAGKNQTLMIRVLCSKDDLILRFRDSCKQFNIREAYELADKEDITKNIGKRLVMNMAKDVMYLNTLNLNTTVIKM